ncbi:uncharacterized protein EDB91DRAFT_1285771 [Suillus paluster]|uniref:uncharacterized protein n=1 Tax=Suillus paluster TaxID=48578 RepID=UPI001B883E68|nr:uncharacterized protein EDB91DRAFT_1285771 [Suillus paluster]KAG1753560.1 hypothetical protein EDB91DRAFT_1285771 [Suillus paluster]
MTEDSNYQRTYLYWLLHVWNWHQGGPIVGPILSIIQKFDVNASKGHSMFVTSARLFFTDIPRTWFDATSENGRTVPWLSWGPQNFRYFPGDTPPHVIIHRSGCIWPTSIPPPWHGLGKVVREPMTFHASIYGFTQDVTYLPYVEVVRTRDLDDIILDEDRVLLFTRPNTETVSLFLLVEPTKLMISLNRST